APTRPPSAPAARGGGLTPALTREVGGWFGLDAIFATHQRIAMGDPTVRRDGDRWWWATRTPAGPATAVAIPGPDRVTVHLWGPGAGEVAVEALLGADDDPSGFVAHDPVVADAVRRFPELRFGRTGTIVDRLIAGVLGQRVTGKAAAEAWRGLVFRFGGAAPGPHPSLRLPPDPAALANEPYYTLHRFGVERNRAQTLIEACKRRNRLEALAREPVAVAHERLTGLRGIGPWTAAHVLGSSHGGADVVQTGDLHLPNGVAWALAGEARADDDRMLALLAPYAGHRGRVLRLLAQRGIGAPKFGPRADATDIRGM
ncbi:MAG: hypothetical protein ABMB14_03065, partial [Myxococcota bacterium]